MSPLHRLVMTLTALVAAVTISVGLAPAASAAAAAAPGAPAASAAPTSASQPCSSVRQIGDRKVVSDLGMSAFTVRQYIGWCSDARGSAWMNFASVYVWDQYHVRGFAYRSYAGIAVRSEPETRGFTSSANRQQLSYSTPVRTTSLCTQGWGKLYRAGSESAQGLTTLVC
jgi:hypothetical protein